MAAAIPKSLFYSAGDGSGCLRQPQNIFDFNYQEYFVFQFFLSSRFIKRLDEASLQKEESKL
jgi:hypothetical protein